MFTNKTVKTVILTLLVLCLALPAFADDAAPAKPILRVGRTTLNDHEIFQMLMSSAGGNQMMAAMILAQSTVEERKEMVEQMADAVVFAEAAKAEGYQTRPDTAFQIKWQTIQILVQAYFSDVAANWDFSDAAMRKYYDAHLDEFVQAPAAKARHILCETEQQALEVAMKLLETGNFEAAAAEYSRDPSSAQNGGDLGWVEKGMMVGPVETAIEKARVGSIVGPVQSEFGWHLIKVEDRRPQHQLTYAEAGQEVAQRMQRAYIDAELKKLREEFPVQIDEEGLANIGGIQAPKPED